MTFLSDSVAPSLVTLLDFLYIPFVRNPLQFLLDPEDPARVSDFSLSVEKSGPYFFIQA